MATVNFIVKKDSSPAQVYVRFYQAEIIDATKKTDLLIDPSAWDKKKQRIRKTKSTPYAEKINNTLDKLKTHIIDQFTISYSSGVIIDDVWLRKTVLEHFNRPVHEVHNIKDNTAIYFADFIQWWLDSKCDNYRNRSSRRKISKRTKGFFQNYKDNVLKYEKAKNTRVKLNQLNQETSEDIMLYLDEEMNYASTTMSKWVFRHNFLCERAIENDRMIPRNYKCIYRPAEQKEVLEPYLNEEEILKIYNHDFSHDERLDNARDNFIIGLNTGLRVSDFLRRLHTDNISDSFIQIKTKKTSKLVAIPLHWMIKKTLDKRLGFLPRRISEKNFNLYIKEICEQAGINQGMEGYLTVTEDKVTRKKLGFYPKYKLVSSHICRRSFATNLFGHVPNSVIMAVGGWSSEKIMLKYIKKTNMESAQELQKFWEKQEKINEEKIKSN